MPLRSYIVRFSTIIPDPPSSFVLLTNYIPLRLSFEGTLVLLPIKLLSTPIMTPLLGYSKGNMVPEPYHLVF